jgi:uncharacterized protein (TIGR03086 family)
MGDEVSDTEMIQRVLGETGRIVDGIEPSQLSRPTPCAEWDVRAVLNHITGGATMFAECIENGSITDDRLVELIASDQLGDDYKASFKTAAEHAVTAFDAPGAAEKIVKLPFGEMPAGVAMNFAIFDVTVHALDLATATGQSTDLDPEVLATALAIGQQGITPEMRTGGQFGAEVAVPNNAPLSDRILAFAGRSARF